MFVGAGETTQPDPFSPNCFNPDCLVEEGLLRFAGVSINIGTLKPGALSAKEIYRANGSVIHHNTDIWGDSGPIDALGGGVWPMGANWISLHLWRHDGGSQVGVCSGSVDDLFYAELRVIVIWRRER